MKRRLRRPKKKLKFKIRTIRQLVKLLRKLITRLLLFKLSIKKRKTGSKVRSSLFKSDSKRKMK